MRYKTKKVSDEDESAVLNEVHVYINPNGDSKAGPYSLQLDRVQKIEILEKDKEKTKSSHVVGWALGICGAVVLLGGLAAIIAVSTVGIY